MMANRALASGMRPSVARNGKTPKPRIDSAAKCILARLNRWIQFRDTRLFLLIQFSDDLADVGADGAQVATLELLRQMTEYDLCLRCIATVRTPQEAHDAPDVAVQFLASFVGLAIARTQGKRPARSSV